MIVDMSDPGKVKEVSRWWVPGQRLGEEAEYKKYIFAGDQRFLDRQSRRAQRSQARGRWRQVGYGGFGAFGMYVMDLERHHQTQAGSARCSTNSTRSALFRFTPAIR